MNRRDPLVHDRLRLRDNPALAAAEAGTVAGVWVRDPRILRRHADAPRRLAFMAACLERRALCPGYPPPVVDLDDARARALAAWEEARRRA